MQKKRIVTEQNEVIDVTCDSCGATSSTIRYEKCHICRKDICWRCQVEHDPWHIGGDYPHQICPECDKIGIPIRKALKEAETIFNERFEELMEEWKMLANENA